MPYKHLSSMCPKELFLSSSGAGDIACYVNTMEA